MLLISHDRAFLDNVTNRTVELSLGKVTDYKVSYSKYVVLRAERRAQQMAAYENQQRMILASSSWSGWSGSKSRRRIFRRSTSNSRLRPVRDRS